MSSLTQSHRVIFGHPLCLIPSTFHIIQPLTQSMSSFHSTRPNHINLLLIIKLMGYNPKSSLEFFIFLSFIQVNPTHPSDHTHFSHSVWFNFNSCSTFIGQVSLPYVRQLLTQVIEKCCMLVVAQMREADRALLGVDDLSLRPAYSKCRLTMAVCTSVTTKQCQHAVDDCLNCCLWTLRCQ